MALVCVLVVNLGNGEDTTNCRHPNLPLRNPTAGMVFACPFVPLTIEFCLGSPKFACLLRLITFCLFPCLHAYIWLSLLKGYERFYSMLFTSIQQTIHLSCPSTLAFKYFFFYLPLCEFKSSIWGKMPSVVAEHSPSWIYSFYSGRQRSCVLRCICARVCVGVLSD